MTTDVKTTTAATVEQAEQAAAEAAKYTNDALNELAGLRKRLADGDASVTAAQLAAAQQERERRELLATGAHAAVKAAKVRELEAVVAAASAANQAARDAWPEALATHVGPIVEHLGALLAACHARNTTMRVEAVKASRAQRARLELMGEKPIGLGVVSVDEIKGEPLLGELIGAAYRSAGLISSRFGLIVEPLNTWGDGVLGEIATRYVRREPTIIPDPTKSADAGQ